VIVDTASWFYVLIVTLIAVIVVYLALSRYGDIKLGPDHAEPAYSYISWFAMLFSAGIGIGMMFYGIAEPVMHFLHAADRARRHASCRHRGHPDQLFSLGFQCLGDLRHCCADSCLLRLPA
jgi:choline-glycine betaine transporter